MKNKEIVFRNETQERIFNFLKKIARNISPETYKKYESEAKQAVELPSIRYEQAAIETFKTPFVSNPTNFQAKAEFWLQTVYLKLEDEKISMLLKVATAMKNNVGTPKEVHPFSFLLAAMNVEPEPTKYVKMKLIEQEKALKAINWDSF